MRLLRHPVTLRQALAIACLIGTLLLALGIMVMVHSELVRHLRADLEEDGRRIAERLAQDSRLAVLLDSADNVLPSVDLALAFPNVAGVALYTPDQRVLVDRLSGGDPTSDDSTPDDLMAEDQIQSESLTGPHPSPEETRLWRETNSHLVLLSPVLIDSIAQTHPLPGSDLERAERAERPDRPADTPRLRGLVVVQMSKAALQETVASVLWNVLLLTLGVALVVYLGLALFVGWLTAPLQRLARVMADPATVTRYTRAPVQGSREARHMARAFNTLITAFAEVNRQLLALNAALDARVTERTRALEQANAELRRASEAKSTFLSAISHELRTPLQGVILSADLLAQSQALDGEQRHIVRSIDSSATLLLGLIDNVLDLARIEAGRLTLQQDPFDLHQVIQRVVSSLLPQAQAKGLDLQVSIDPGLPHCLVGDPVRLGQVLINLLGNAVKFTPQGRVTLRAWSDGGDAAPVALHLEVEDSGIGIAPADQVRLFQPFEQLEPATGRHYGGTGLGMTITRHLVDLMGGQIAVDSREGQGCRFRIDLTLPRVLQATRVAACLESQSVAPTPGGAERDRPVHPLRILVAEDNPVNGALLEQTLRTAGHAPRLVTDGQQALKAVFDEPFDLAIVDRHMPLFDGNEVIDHYHRQCPDGKLPFILVSADATPATADVARASSVEKLLIKPVTIDALLTAIAEVIDAHQTISTSDHSRCSAPLLAADSATGTGERQDSIIARAQRHVHSAAFVAQLRRLYIENVGRCLVRLDTISATGEPDALREVIHELKGGSLAVGQEDVVDLCQAIQSALNEGATAVAQNRLASLRQRLRAIVESP